MNIFWQPNTATIQISNYYIQLQHTRAHTHTHADHTQTQDIDTQKMYRRTERYKRNINLLRTRRIAIQVGHFHRRSQLLLLRVPKLARPHERSTLTRNSAIADKPCDGFVLHSMAWLTP